MGQYRLVEGARGPSLAVLLSRRLAVWLVLTLAGCFPPPRPAVYVPPYGFYSNPQFDPSSVRRVLLMPLSSENRYAQAAEAVQVALATALQSSGQFEIVAAPAELSVLSSERLHLTGRFDEYELAELSRRYQVDAVVMGAVTHFRPYEPVSLGLSLQMISTAEAVVIASLDGLWDTQDRGVADHARRWYAGTLDTGETLLEHDLVLASPHLFQQFVCHEVVQILAGNPASSRGRGSLTQEDATEPASAPLTTPAVPSRR